MTTDRPFDWCQAALIACSMLIGCGGGGAGSDDGGGGGGGGGGETTDAGRDAVGFDLRITIPTRGMAEIRFVNVFGPGGVKSAIDLHVKVDAWRRLTANLAYGAATEHLPVPLAGFGDTRVVITAPGGDPAMVPASADRTILVNSATGTRYTYFLHDTFAPGMRPPAPADRLSWSNFDDRAAFLAPAAGKTIIQGIKQTISSTEFFWSWSLAGRGCLGGGDGLNNERAVLDPGNYTVGGADAATSGCIGPVVIMPAMVEAVAGSAYFVFPVGEARSDLKLTVLPVSPR